ncbi:hypothetical protein EBB79_08940 [Parasedimentitalea marina]|uniref:Uncharacterized protein n=1 Tax=Parasedimentitalea marina TaxID=2483033 RepID=A0A3T0N1Z1_9RHOB|nr:hypothetical protein [Parasedimentitalea marina]AZV78007.1 hypothetical protein EBB79_08940 [Parasedimentitalea marina]
MNALWRWTKRSLLALILLAMVLAVPIVYVETSCQGEALGEEYASLIPVEYHRTESRTFMTYPEWHIVHAYDDYGRVIQSGDPHEYGYLSGIVGYWSSLCALSEKSAAHGGIDSATKQMVYVIGSSFTLELAMKAAYEETLGRVTAWIRGAERAATDELSAEQAAAYAHFLQQVPWYKWNFRGDAEALSAVDVRTFRDTERKLALGLEYRVKAAYADVIATAVAQTGGDELTLRMVVTSTDPVKLASFKGVKLIKVLPNGVVIETPRYRILTAILVKMAQEGIEFVEIAGNDDILFTALSPDPSHIQALYSFARQGYDDYRHLIVVKVSELADVLRGLDETGLRLEHIHDY